MEQYCFYTRFADAAFYTKQFRTRTQTFAPDKCKYSVGPFMCLSGLCVAGTVCLKSYCTPTLTLPSPKLLFQGSSVLFVISDIISLFHFFVLFIETINCSDYIALDDKMTDELGKVKDEAVVTSSMVLR